MADFFREVDEDYRRDRAVQFWTKYQYWFLGFALLVVAATGAWRYYNHIRTEAAEAAGAKYEAAMQLSVAGKAAEAEAAFDELAKTAPKGYASLARLRAADEIAARDPEAGIKAFEALAADQTYNEDFRDLARLRAAVLSADRGDPKEVEQRLAPFATQSFPYRNTIRELLGLVAFRRNDFEAAGRWFDAIVADPQASSALRQRADAFLGLVQAGALSPEAPPAQAMPPASAPSATPGGETPKK
ncbi:tetratricopeptide repeat protein [Methylocapsa acidiphila]|uniref:tetratricopeptide repeat protein n=1 Tax=Methylocapsa acidiphila TaxID=133552 RepID=UPI00040EB7A3|nr:tetratricopeptide repeat protein [Methylocapsa acidiphila]